MRESFSNGVSHQYGPTKHRNSAGFFGVVGGGIERALTPRLALRVDGSAIFFLYSPVGARMTTTLVARIGR